MQSANDCAFIDKQGVILTTVNGIEVPPGASVVIFEAHAEAEVIKAADIAAAAAAEAAESKE